MANKQKATAKLESGLLGKLVQQRQIDQKLRQKLAEGAISPPRGVAARSQTAPRTRSPTASRTRSPQRVQPRSASTKPRRKPSTDMQQQNQDLLMTVNARAEKLREMEYVLERKQEELNKKQAEIQRLSVTEDQLRQQIEGEKAAATESEQQIDEAIKEKREELKRIMAELAV